MFRYQYFGDAAGELFDVFEKAGATMVGRTSTDGYDHSSSKADRDGQFVGFMCDEDNQYDMSEDRAVSSASDGSLNQNDALSLPCPSPCNTCDYLGNIPHCEIIVSQHLQKAWVAQLKGEGVL